MLKGHNRQQRETLLAQGIANCYPLQNSIITKLFDTVALFLLLNETIDTVYDMENKRNNLIPSMFAAPVRRSTGIVLLPKLTIEWNVGVNRLIVLTEE